MVAGIADVVAALAHLPFGWAIAGGWAIDLALDRETRPHADVDVALFRRDQRALREALPSWPFEKVVNGTLVPWPADEWLELPVHEVYGRRDGVGAPLEFLLNEREGEDWFYRRDASIRRPAERVFLDASSGVRVLAPEIVLLYKSRAPRVTDEHDFRVGLELLDGDARSWLRAAIARRAPDHPWLSMLVTED